MRSVFADTSYWIAVLSPSDQNRQWAARLSLSLAGLRLVTSEAVLTEVLNFVSRKTPEVRTTFLLGVRKTLRDPDWSVVENSNALFESALTFFERRADQQYSLTDCMSMVIMREQEILEVLTVDQHFVQEGFVMLV